MEVSVGFTDQNEDGIDGCKSIEDEGIRIYYQEGIFEIAEDAYITYEIHPWMQSVMVYGITMKS